MRTAARGITFSINFKILVIYLRINAFFIHSESRPDIPYSPLQMHLRPNRSSTITSGYAKRMLHRNTWADFWCPSGLKPAIKSNSFLQISSIAFSFLEYVNAFGNAICLFVPCQVSASCDVLLHFYGKFTHNPSPYPLDDLIDI
ncbi:hypothetical protein EGR_07558 [Echinococcus granulosus]|uniref:Uncharacterized protein n=1 Tax=Echinococcus granulosus TaxID=6210 RepID=W6UHI8_ECHGR|nr:hypothetical protein EGR_07558 [Echinococcus granulosus]EUB57547.1 hypothetical protein EGR_07558 [Echinococcus granulosus]